MQSRLQRSGAQKIIYIIEEFNKEEAVQFGLQAIQTAMSSTQVVDGFFLKRTASISDTVDYLVNITKMVQKMYEVSLVIGICIYDVFISCDIGCYTLQDPGSFSEPSNIPGSKTSTRQDASRFIPNLWCVKQQIRCSDLGRCVYAYAHDNSWRVLK